MSTHLFHLDAQWFGGRNSEGWIEAGGLQEKISIPASVGGSWSWNKPG